MKPNTRLFCFSRLDDAHVYFVKKNVRVEMTNLVAEKTVFFRSFSTSTHLLSFVPPETRAVPVRLL